MQRCIAVAYSGGRDSSALLHSTLTSAAAQGIDVVALHVHHGLSTNADAWLAHCEAQCKRWAAAGRPVRFAFRRLEERPAHGESVEAWARRERYRALREMALDAGANAVLLGHHRRDQAETVLLQALRGAGTAGLAGMPASIERAGVWWLRPWLDRDEAEIAAYVRRHRLRHIIDDSNVDPRYARNRLRHDVWPALQHAFADADVTLAATARWAAQATSALRELADLDLAPMLDADGALDIAAWTMLSEARRANALRAWLQSRAGDVAAPASLIVRLLDELIHTRSGCWQHPGGMLRLYRRRLRFESTCVEAQVDIAHPRETTLRIDRVGRYALPGWGGELSVAKSATEGVPLAWLGQLDLRPRSGAEQFQSGIGRPPRSLKKQFQSAGIAAWDRDGPLVYSGGQLVFVPGLGVDARVWGPPGQPLVTLHWRSLLSAASG